MKHDPFEMNVHDPLHSLREACKQAVLLEDHLFHPPKRCQDCISKHLMAMEALVEETITLDVTGRLRPLLGRLLTSVLTYQVLWATRQGGPHQIAQAVRRWRKGLTTKLLMPRLMSRTASTEAARNTALSLLEDASGESFEGLVKLVRQNAQYLMDPITRQRVDAEDVVVELAKLMGEEEEDTLPGGYITVYHATDKRTAQGFLKRGAIPEMKPRPRVPMDYAPGKGIDVGLYVGHSARAVNSYGPVVLSVDVPKKWLEVPTELSQLGYRDPMKALHEHDGAIIKKRIPAKAFKVVLGKVAHHW
jgi:hypothetical protein